MAFHHLPPPSMAFEQVIRAATEPAAALVEVCGRALHLGNELNSGHRVFGTSTLPPNLTL